jgi:hypothetical protein
MGKLDLSKLKTLKSLAEIPEVKAEPEPTAPATEAPQEYSQAAVNEKINKLNEYLQSQVGRDDVNPFLWAKHSGFDALIIAWAEDDEAVEVGQKILALPEQPNCGIKQWEFKPTGKTVIR